MAPSLAKTKLRNEIAMERSQLDRPAVLEELKRQLRELENDERNQGGEKSGASSTSNGGVRVAMSTELPRLRPRTHRATTYYNL